MLTRANPQGCEGSIEASGYQEAHQQSKYSPVTLPVNQQDTSTCVGHIYNPGCLHVPANGDLTRCRWAVVAKPEDPGTVSPDVCRAVPAEKLSQSGCDATEQY